jgi:hypothetical protein
MSYIVRYNNEAQRDALKGRLLNKLKQANPNANIEDYGKDLVSINGQEFAIELDKPLRPEIEAEITPNEINHLEDKHEDEWQ